MNYDQIVDEKIPKPKSSYSDYEKAVTKAIDGFLNDNKVLKLIESGEFSTRHYHSLLKHIFHQVFFSSTSFAMGGAMASQVSLRARAYLMHHAEEEKDHWIWILEDLNSTGFKGTDPRGEHPNWASQAYLSYGVFLSLFNPLGRLAMANVLEGISAKFGVMYGKKALMSLKIGPDQAKFFLAHGELDQGHTADIMDLLKKENLSGEQWAEMISIAENTSKLYKNIYNLSVG